jgi:hypothetical protein
MATFEYLVASLLLCTSPDTGELRSAADWHPFLAPGVQAVALEFELLDQREVRYLLARPEDFASDLKLLQTRRRELATAPPVDDGARFPDRALINDLMTANRAYRQELTQRLAIDRINADALRAAVAETDHLYRIWDSVRDARCDYYYVTVRRQALQQLRELVGAEAYFRGELPPHVPWWRMPRAN